MYGDLLQLKHILEFSEYHKNHHLFSVSNNKVTQKISEELNGDILVEAVFLKPKA